MTQEKLEEVLELHWVICDAEREVAFMANDKREDKIRLITREMTDEEIESAYQKIVERYKKQLDDAKSKLAAL